MDAPKFQKSDPAILLLNEIDILLAQTRLMELYLKQAQATAANENARIHEQYEAELSSLRANLADKERQLQQRPAIAVDRDLSATVEQLQRELSEKHQIVSRQETTLQRSNSEIVALQQRIAQLETDNGAALSAARESNAIRESLAADVSALNLELESNRREFHQQQLAAREFENGLREQLQLLQNQVAEKQADAFNSDDELRKAEQEIAALRHHLSSLQTLQDELQANATLTLEQAHGRFESELASLRSALTERDRSVLQSQSALVEIERGLRSEIDTLRQELEQKQAALRQRDDEVRGAGTQIAALQQRITELELAHRQASAAAAEIDSQRRALAEEVADLQHEVAVKEKELVNRYEAVTAVELALHGRIQALQQELARAQEASSADAIELENHRTESATLQSRIVELERAHADTSLLDATRRELESDLNRLRADLAQKEYLLSERERAIAELEARYGAEIATLRQQLEKARSATAQTQNEVQQARNDLAAGYERLEAQLKQKDQEIISLRASATGQSAQLSQQVSELQARLADRESALAHLEARLGSELAALRQQLARERSGATRAHDELAGLQAELASMREGHAARLALKDQELDNLRAGAGGHTEQLSNRIDELQLQLAEKQLLADSRSGELDHLRTAVSQLSEQLSEKAANHAQYRDEFASLTTERNDYARQRTALEVQLDQARGANAAIRGELQETKNRSAELEALLQSQQSATAAVEAERARLRQDLAELDARHRQSLADDSRAMADLRAGLAAELNALRGEVQQKAWSLAQHQANVENLAQVHREQIRRLEARLNDHRPGAEQRTQAFDQALNRADDLQRQVEELQAALQQTQAAGASQAEQIRQEYAARLAAVNNQLAVKSAELANSGAVRANVEESLRAELSRLRGETQARTEALQSREDELNRVRAEMTAVQNRIVQLESVSARSESEAREISQAKSGLEGDLDSLRGELQQKAAAVAQQQAAMDELAANYRHQVAQLEANLSAQQQAGEQRRREADQAQAQIDQLHGRIAELQSALQQAEVGAQRRAEELRQEYPGPAAALRQERAGHGAELEQSAAIDAAPEQALRSEIDRLIGEAQERNRILQDRNDELVRVKNDLDSFAERFNRLESHARQTESHADGEAESMRTEFQAQLALLQAELSQKEWALEERQAIVASLEQEHRQQIEALRRQLAEKETVAMPADGRFVLGNPNLTDEQREKLMKLDDIDSDLPSGNQLSGGLMNRRRWHGGFGSKRRWRS